MKFWQTARFKKAVLKLVNFSELGFVLLMVYFILIVDSLVEHLGFARELQRLDCVTRSPIMAHLSQTLGGLTTIRAFR